MKPIKRFSLSILTAIFVVVVVFGSMSYVQPAKAVLPVHDAAWDLKEVKLTFDQLLETAVLNASLQAMSYFTRKFAYDSAVWLSSGGKGQNPFAHTSSFGDYVSNVADNAVGAGIEALGSPFGLNLCKIPDARLDLVLRLSLPNLYGINGVTGGEYPPKPNCSFSDFQKNWTMKNFNSMYGADNIADRFNADFKTDQSDLGIFISATTKIDRLRAQEVYNKEKQRTEDDGAIGFTDLISGNIKTPGQVMMGEIKSQSPSEGKKVSDEQINSAFSAGVYQILPSTLSVFLNTLAGQMLNNYQTKGMFPFGIGYSESGGSADFASQGYGSGGLSGRRLAQQLFSEYRVASVKSVDNYTILARFQTCPDNPAPDNCVANEDLASALQEGTFGNPITIGEALDRKILIGDRKLISPLRVAENKDPKCFENAYCYRNVQMLRKARILPLGFEIAASLSDPDKPWTLQDVVNGYNDCNERKDATGKVIGINYDPAGHPFCHLIDPNWILKVPDSKCNSMAIGPSPLASGLPNRAEECVDMSSCVQYQDNKCVAYGYCTKERNVWKFQVDTCEAQYNSCRSFSNVATGEQTSYLYRTLDTGNCDANNVGCRGYSLTQDNDRWVYPSVSPDNVNTVSGQRLANVNTGIFISKNNSCTSDSAGCTAFNFVENAGGAGDLFLRKAPDYLKCYDRTPSTAVLDWPLTESDLSLLQPKADCSKYAKPCIPEEVDCNWYTPINSKGTPLTSERIPGKYTPGTDECNGVCVGYDAYREMSSNFSIGEDLAYIIPKSGRECSATEEGCSGFTNLSTTAGGLEQVEYYSFLRSCILPDPAKQKTYYTYAGSIVNGYELIVYNLEEDKNGDSDPSRAAGGPKYFYKTAGELSLYKNQCNETQYLLGSSPDCRQFNDAKGHVFYRFLSQTVAVSDQCTPYRLNETALTTVSAGSSDECTAVQGRWNAVTNICEACLQNGEFRSDDGHCYYYGLPAGVELSSGASATCNADKNTCRKYKGNRANNVDVGLFADFDESDKDLANWSVPAGQGNIVLSLESTHLGQHSMAFNVVQAAGEVHRSDLDLNPGDSHEISFWAKGDVGRITIGLANNEAVELGSVSVTDVWRNYKLGYDKILGGTTTSTILSFKASGTGHLFLDNIRLASFNDALYLVKNTLKVDPLCDSNLNDNFPGEALGCTEYRTNKNESKYLTGFSYLCREGAIGCTALLDTKNTLDTDKSKVFNLWVPTAKLASMKTYLGKEPCTVASGALGCYVNDPIIDKTPTELTASAQGGEFTPSTIYIPADTSTTTPMYLVASETERFDCNPASIGCVEAGAVVQGVNGAQFVTTTLKNDPALYTVIPAQAGIQAGILCQHEAEGCTAYNSQQGNTYFKDPKLTNARICTWSDQTTINGTAFKGWFWKDVGVCVNNNQVRCSSDVECPGSTCNKVEPVPCYPDYLQGGTIFGLWSYGNKPQYDNYVGECPAEKDNCKEFVDHDNNNHPYYLIADNKMTQGDCDNGISRKFGCILLDDTGQPNKTWNSKATYNASQQKGFEKVKPSSTGATNDSNIIAQVSRDRECAEWLYPSQIHPNSEGVNKSYGLGVCNEAQSGTGFITQCADDITASWLGKGEYMDAAKYVGRPNSWNDVEYSGFTLFNSFQIADLAPVMVSSSYQLVHESIFGNENNQSANAATGVQAGQCLGVLQNLVVNGKRICGRDNDKDGLADGRCYNEKCVYTPGGVLEKNKNLFAEDSGYIETKSCRGYPEIDSPFPVSVADTARNTFGGILRYKKDFEGVNVCELEDRLGAVNNCDCNYQKVTYGSGGEVKQYYGFGNTQRENVQNPLVADAVYDKKSESFLEGWQGYCAQKDIRRSINGFDNENACLTWYPVDVPLGVQDIAGRNDYAGYNGIDKTRYMCLENQPFKPRKSDTGIITHYSRINTGDSGWAYFNSFISSDYSTYSSLRSTYDLPSSMLVYYDPACHNEGLFSGDTCYNIASSVSMSGISPSNVVVNNPNFAIKSLDDFNDHREKYERLNYKDIFYADERLYPHPPYQLPSGRTDEYIHKEDIKQIDIYVDADNHFDGVGDKNGGFTTPNIIAVYPHGIYDNQGNIVNYGKGLFNAGTGAVTRGQNQHVNTYYEFKSSAYTGMFSQGTIINENTQSGLLANNDQDGNVTAYGFRVIFDGDDDRLLGIMIDLHDDSGEGTSGDAYLGYFFIIHLTNGTCKTVAQISEVDANGRVKSKTNAWRMSQNDSIGRLGIDTNQHPYDANALVIRRLKFNDDEQQLDVKPYGLISGDWDPSKTLQVHQFSVGSFIEASSNFRSYNDVLMMHENGYDGGIPLTVFSDIETANNFHMNCDDTWNAVVTPNSTYCGMLSRMFAKVYNIFDLQDNGTYIQRQPGSLPSVTDAASPLSTKYSTYKPKIAAVDFSCGTLANEDTGCGMADLDKFSVGREYNDDMFINQSGAVVIGFFAWADAALMPLTRIKVDFDNETSVFVSDNGKQANYKPYCDTGFHCDDDRNIPCSKLESSSPDCPGNDDCVANTEFTGSYGSTGATGCEQKYYNVYGNYTCDAKALFSEMAQRLIWNEASAGDAKYNPNDDPNVVGNGHLAVMRDSPDSAKPWELKLTETAKDKGLLDGSVVCAYRPKVQVLDNWGWCSGRCTHGNYTSNYVPSVNTFVEGCYNEMPVDISPPETFNQCDLSLNISSQKNVQNYIPFGGFGNEKNVIVIPSY